MIFNKDTTIKELIEQLSLGSVTGISFQKDGLVKNCLRITMITDNKYKLARLVSEEELYKTDFEIIDYLTEKMTEELSLHERSTFDANTL